MLKLLWVDPDTAYIEDTAARFKEFPHALRRSATKHAAMQEFLAFQPECALLEMHLLDGSGLEICRKIRAYSKIPILFLTTDLSSASAVSAFNAGANDYIRKPCAPAELQCRLCKECIQSLSCAFPTEEESNITINNLTIQLKSRRVFLNGESIILTPIEFNILLLLTEHVNQTVPIDVFYEKFWNTPDLRETSRVLQAHISNLRRKLNFHKNCNIRITNLYGKGYGLSVDECRAASPSP